MRKTMMKRWNACVVNRKRLQDMELLAVSIGCYRPMSSSYEASGKSRLPLVETVQSVPVKLAMQPALQTNMWSPQKPSMQVEARQLLDSSRRALDKLVRRGTRTGTSRSSFNRNAAESARKVGPHPFVPYLCVSCCVPRSC